MSLPTQDQINNMTVKELQEALERLNLSRTGKKEILQSRLTSYISSNPSHHPESFQPNRYLPLDIMRTIFAKTDAKSAVKLASVSRPLSQAIKNHPELKVTLPIQRITDYQKYVLVPDGKRLITKSSGEDNFFSGLSAKLRGEKNDPSSRTALRIINLTNGTLIHKINYPENITRNYIDFNETLAVSPDGRYFATCFNIDNAIQLYIYNLTDYRLVRTVYIGQGKLKEIAFSQNGEMIAVYLFSEVNGELMFVDTSTGVYTNRFEVLGTDNPELLFSPDGRYLVIKSLYRIEIWDVLKKSVHQILNVPEQTSRRRRHFYIRIQFIPGKNVLLTSCSDKTIRAIKLKTKEELYSLTDTIADDGAYGFYSHANFWDISKSGVIAYLVRTADKKNIIKLHNVYTGKHLKTITPLMLRKEAELSKPNAKPQELPKNRMLVHLVFSPIDPDVIVYIDNELYTKSSMFEAPRILTVYNIKTEQVLRTIFLNKIINVEQVQVKEACLITQSDHSIDAFPNLFTKVRL